MSKAVLVMDYLPTRCCDCELENDIKLNKTICHVSLRDISDSEYSQKKPDWCPLRELPEKMPELKSGYEDISTSIRRVGWNACLNEILKTDGMRKE